MPPEILSGSLVNDTMVSKHLDLYEWGTSNPIYSRLESTDSEGFIDEDGVDTAFGITTSSALNDANVGGIFTTSGVDHRTLTEINCGEGSYLERVSPPPHHYWL